LCQLYSQFNWLPPFHGKLHLFSQKAGNIHLKKVLDGSQSFEDYRIAYKALGALDVEKYAEQITHLRLMGVIRVEEWKKAESLDTHLCVICTSMKRSFKGSFLQAAPQGEYRRLLRLKEYWKNLARPHPKYILEPDGEFVTLLKTD